MHQIVHQSQPFVQKPQPWQSMESELAAVINPLAQIFNLKIPLSSPPSTPPQRTLTPKRPTNTSRLAVTRVEEGRGAAGERGDGGRGRVTVIREGWLRVGWMVLISSYQLSRRWANLPAVSAVFLRVLVPGGQIAISVCTWNAIRPNGEKAIADTFVPPRRAWSRDGPIGQKTNSSRVHVHDGDKAVGGVGQFWLGYVGTFAVLRDQIVSGGPVVAVMVVVVVVVVVVVWWRITCRGVGVGGCGEREGWGGGCERGAGWVAGICWFAVLDMHAGRKEGVQSLQLVNCPVLSSVHLNCCCCCRCSCYYYIIIIMCVTKCKANDTMWDLFNVTELAHTVTPPSQCSTLKTSCVVNS